MPMINWMLLVMVIAVVLAFKESNNLAAAYGIAVTTTMVITTLLAAVVMREIWKWNSIFVAFVIGLFLFVDVAFFCANVLKIAEGGWFPLLLGALCFLLLGIKVESYCVKRLLRVVFLLSHLFNLY